MPTSLRSWRSAALSALTVCPAMVIVPDWILSSPFTQRSSVDLPEPERPISAVTPPLSTVSETPFSTSSGPKDLCTLSMTTSGMKPPFHPARQTG